MLKPRKTDELREELLGEKGISKHFSEPHAKEKVAEISEIHDKIIHFKVRFDFKGKSKPARFFFGRKNTEEMAHVAREQQVALWKHIPLQGIDIVKIDTEETYAVLDEDEGEEIAYAPLVMEVKASTLEDLVMFVVREEFRRLEIIEPNELKLTRQGLERLFFKFHQATKEQVFLQIKRLQE